MNLIALYLGQQDYNRFWGLELTLLGVSVFIGTAWSSWIMLRIESQFPYFYREARWKWIEKEIVGERFIEMLVRRLAPDWRAR